MVKELANSVDNTDNVSVSESFAVSALQILAVPNLSLGENNSDAQNHVHTDSAISGADNLTEERSQNIENSVSKRPPDELIDSLAGRVATVLSSIASREVTDSMKLTPELKAAVDNSSTVTVKAPGQSTSSADLVIKRDGSVAQYLNMNPKRDDRQNLTIAIETDSTAGQTLTREQEETLNELIAYTNAKSKNLSFESPSSSSTATANVTEDEDAVYKKRPVSPINHSRNWTAPEAHSTIQNVGDGNSGAHSFSGSQPRSFERSASYGTGNDTSDSVSLSQRDWTQIDLFELLMDWFGTDPETFKRLMPGLYKRIAGADGKIDPKKLRQLQESRDPILDAVRNQLPRLAEAFPQASGASGGQCKSSGDAVNSTGALLANKAEQVSEELASTGYCAKGVSFAIERATGKVIWGNANDMRESLPDQGFTVAQSKDLKVGQVVHVYWTPEVYAQEQARRGPCPNYGDIAVIGKGRDGQLYAYNDAATPLDEYLRKSRYDWNTLKVFNPPSSQTV